MKLYYIAYGATMLGGHTSVYAIETPLKEDYPAKMLDVYKSDLKDAYDLYDNIGGNKYSIVVCESEFNSFDLAVLDRAVSAKTFVMVGEFSIPIPCGYNPKEHPVKAAKFMSMMNGLFN